MFPDVIALQKSEKYIFIIPLKFVLTPDRKQESGALIGCHGLHAAYHGKEDISRDP